MKQLSGFQDFIREQGVMALTIGFILGGSVKGLVDSLVLDIISPLLGLLLNRVVDLADLSFFIQNAEIKYGNFLLSLIDLIVISAIVYFGVKKLGLDKIDKKKVT